MSHVHIWRVRAELTECEFDKSMTIGLSHERSTLP